MPDAIQSLTIREAFASDAGLIAEYNTLLALESEGLKLDPETIRGGAARALERRDLCRYFIAELDGVAVGQTMITYEWSDWGNGVIWWIQSVYVDASHRREGVFTRIFEWIEAQARADSDVIALRLYVHHDNRKARAAYERLGMRPLEYVLYEKPTPALKG